jgi:hypothetical protein
LLGVHWNCESEYSEQHGKANHGDSPAAYESTMSDRTLRVGECERAPTVTRNRQETRQVDAHGKSNNRNTKPRVGVSEVHGTFASVPNVPLQATESAGVESDCPSSVRERRTSPSASGTIQLTFSSLYGLERFLCLYAGKHDIELERQGDDHLIRPGQRQSASDLGQQRSKPDRILSVWRAVRLSR